MKQTDQDLIRRCIAKDGKSQKQLYYQYYNEMIKVCKLYTYNIEDAAQLFNEAMFKVFNTLSLFKGECELKAWIRKIVVNTCIDFTRKKVKYIIVNIEHAEAAEQYVHPESYSNLYAEETLQLLHQLPTNTALVFNLYVIEGYKHQEIGKILGISSGTSKWHLSEARRLLKEMLANYKDKIYKNVI